MNKRTLLITTMGTAIIFSASARADVCGDGLNLPANIWTMFSAPCIPPSGGATLNDQFNGDLGAGAAYDSTWIMFKWNAGTAQYEQLAADDTLEQGVGYWIYSKQAGILKIDNGHHTTAGAVYQGDCSAYGWVGQPCYKIDLAVPTATEGTKWNQVGYPFVRRTEWAAVHVAYSTDSGTNWTDIGAPTAADLADYINKNGYVYNDTGNAYDVFDDTASSPSDNTLLPNKSYWFQSKHVSGTTNLALLVPAPPYTVFVTSQTWTGDLGGLAGADGLCQTAADESEIESAHGKHYKAYLSDSHDTTDSRLENNGPFVRMDGVLFATDWQEIRAGFPLTTLNVTEHAQLEENNEDTIKLAWTGTGTNYEVPYSPSSLGAPYCADWTSEDNALAMETGCMFATDPCWLRSAGCETYYDYDDPDSGYYFPCAYPQDQSVYPCSAQAHLYCVEQETAY